MDMSGGESDCSRGKGEIQCRLGGEDKILGVGLRSK